MIWILSTVRKKLQDEEEHWNLISNVLLWFMGEEDSGNRLL